MISFIFMEPQTPGNIGATARVLKNFGFSRLVLINPRCDALGKDARDRSKHGFDVLKKAVIARPSILNTFDLVIATTSKLGSDYNIARTPITPEQLCDSLPRGAFASRRKPHVGILFGREGDGLTNKEILAADVVVSIPSCSAYPALNLSHAAAIMAYELGRHSGRVAIHDHIAPVSRMELKHMVMMMDRLIDSVSFATKDKKETQRKLWRRVFSKSFLSRRESFAVMGLLRKLISR